MHYTPIWNRLRSIRANILLCWGYIAQLSYTRNSIEKWQLIDLILAGNPGCSLKYYVSKIIRTMTNEVSLYTLSSTRDIKNKNDSIFCGFALTLTYPWPDKKYQEFFFTKFQEFWGNSSLGRFDGLSVIIFYGYRRYLIIANIMMNAYKFSIKGFLFIIFILTRLIEYHA